jgi:hypothetical protein
MHGSRFVQPSRLARMDAAFNRAAAAGDGVGTALVAAAVATLDAANIHGLESGETVNALSAAIRTAVEDGLRRLPDAVEAALARQRTPRTPSP